MLRPAVLQWFADTAKLDDAAPAAPRPRDWHAASFGPRAHRLLGISAKNPPAPRSRPRVTPALWTAWPRRTQLRQETNFKLGDRSATGEPSSGVTPSKTAAVYRGGSTANLTGRRACRIDKDVASHQGRLFWFAVDDPPSYRRRVSTNPCPAGRRDRSGLNNHRSCRGRAPLEREGPAHRRGRL